MTLSFCYSIKFLRKDHRTNLLLLDFTCATAKDELEKHPEMQTIAMVELENNFPSEFSREVLKCLPPDVAKIIINPHWHPYRNITLMIPKQTLVLYIADKVDWGKTFFVWQFYNNKNVPVVSHLSKHLIVSSDETKIDRTQEMFTILLNVVQVYQKNQKVITKSYDRTRKLAVFENFESSQRENLSQILFPDKAKNLNGQKIFAVWDSSSDAHPYKGSDGPNNKWIPYLEIIAEKLNATLKITRIFPEYTNPDAHWKSKHQLMRGLIENEELDFYLNYEFSKFDLESYSNEAWCFLAPVPKPFSITELILFLPMDKSCWMWLGITIAVSTFIWRISEGHWNFAFGFFSYFMGQAQLIIRIRTNRLTMKILLQLLIFTIFIFSNGYQSLVTSFMLNPMQQKLLKTVDEVLDSDLNVYNNPNLKPLYGSNSKYQKAERDGRLIAHGSYFGNWTKKMIEMNVASIQPCKLNKMRIEFQGKRKNWRGIYQIDEAIYTLPNELYILPMHLYLEKFQELMDRSLEAGLHQAWERFFWEIWRKAEERRKPDEDKKILDFGLIAPFFLILVFGLPAALLALFCEIFWKDFVMELTKEYFERKLKEIFGKKIKVEERKPKVRRIQVKPIARRSSI